MTTYRIVTMTAGSGLANSQPTLDVSGQSANTATPQAIAEGVEHHEHDMAPLIQHPVSQSHSQRSRSHSRSPHRHRHRRRRFRFKEKERNFLAAVCSMIVIVTLCTALAEPNWFYMRGGGCRSNSDNKSPVHTLGVYQFFYTGHFEDTSNVKNHIPEQIYHFSGNDGDVLINCVTPRIAQVMRSILALCFVGVIFSLMAFLLDLAGPSDKMMKILRRNAVFNILTVVVCVTVNGFSFLVTQLLEALQTQTKEHRFAKIDVRFDVSFYLVAAAGAASVVAAAFNLLRRYPPHEHSSEQRENLLDDYEGMDIPPLRSIGVVSPATTSAGTTEALAPVTYMQPPPAYSP